MSSLKIALIGYGKMGKMVHALAHAYQMEVKAIIDPRAEEATAQEITRKSLENIDVCIEFTNPDQATKNIYKIAALHIPLVVGTTGWYQELDTVKKFIKDHEGALVFAPNFSLGVAYFSKIVKEAAKILSSAENIETTLIDIHHKQKKDAPSGTAEALAHILREENITPTISSLRIGEEVGSHIVNFDLPSEKMTLSHSLTSREPLARGALYAAERIHTKKGTYTFHDIL
jgi:4-hydroxy-tetrahydrodipicolinate reductase